MRIGRGNKRKSLPCSLSSFDSFSWGSGKLILLIDEKSFNVPPSVELDLFFWMFTFEDVYYAMAHFLEHLSQTLMSFLTGC
jgi:hypothetical protein